MRSPMSHAGPSPSATGPTGEEATSDAGGASRLVLLGAAIILSGAVICGLAAAGGARLSPAHADAVRRLFRRRPELVSPLLAGRGPDAAALVALSAACTVVAPVLFAAGLMEWPERARAPRVPLLPATAAAVVTLAAAFWFWPGAGRALAVTGLARPRGPGTLAAALAVAAAWLALA